MIIYHNSRCGKSRDALELLRSKGFSVTVREYLKEPPNAKELKDILKKLNCKAIDIVRKKENLYLEKFQHQTLSNEAWLKVLCEHPVLIERPIVIAGNKAIVARPPELLNDFIKNAD